MASRRQKSWRAIFTVSLTVAPLSSVRACSRASSSISIRRLVTTQVYTSEPSTKIGTMYVEIYRGSGVRPSSPFKIGRSTTTSDGAARDLRVSVPWSIPRAGGSWMLTDLGRIFLPSDKWNVWRKEQGP